MAIERLDIKPVGIGNVLVRHPLLAQIYFQKRELICSRNLRNVLLRRGKNLNIKDIAMQKDGNVLVPTAKLEEKVITPATAYGMQELCEILLLSLHARLLRLRKEDVAAEPRVFPLIALSSAEWG